MTDDIVKRLRDTVGGVEWALSSDMLIEAADEIEKLRAELVEVQRFASEMDKNALAKAETCTMLMKDNEKLRAALKPFAVYSLMDNAPTLADYRAAKTALGESDD